MNWRRGLIRLWIVFSMAWVGVVCVLDNPLDPMNAFQNQREIAEARAAGRIHYDGEDSAEAIAAWVAAEHAGNDTMAHHLAAAKIVHAESDGAIEAYFDAHRGRGFAIFAAIAFVPPLFLLIGGFVGWWVLRWVLRGFQRMPFERGGRNQPLQLGPAIKLLERGD